MSDATALSPEASPVVPRDGGAASEPVRFDNSYARLPSRFFARLDPTPVRGPKLVRVNRDLARQLQIDPDWLASADGVGTLAGTRVAAGSEPIATAYAGHQFGHFSPQLGDGRAILLGEVVGRDGRRYDLQLKGSGPTPFSRMGDGRAALGPVLREYIVSEAMAALGIPTTRALAAVTTGESIVRERLLPGAILTRVASSHIRVGTFEFFAARGDMEAVRTLADHVIARHYPAAADAPNPYRALFDAVIARQADLVAQWLNVGFVHGVMNTDNTSVAGETIDYGPCAFIDAYDPAASFSSIDQHGRYAYGSQPRIIRWNLTRLAETLLTLFADEEKAAVASATEALEAFPARFEAAYFGGLRRKLGLLTDREEDLDLTNDLLKAMAENKADFTLVFRRLSEAADTPEACEGVRDLFIDPTAFDRWETGWRARLVKEREHDAARAAAMRAVNPAYVPRNHGVEAALSAAIEQGDFKPFEELLTVLSRPYEEQPGFERYAEPPGADWQSYRTFCGT